MPDAGVKEWYRVVELFKAKGELASLNFVILELYCETYARYQDLSATVSRVGLAVVSKGDGKPTTIGRSAFADELRMTRQQLLDLIERLGLEDL